MPSRPSLKSVEALCGAAMKQQLHDTLESLAVSSTSKRMPAPEEFVRHYAGASQALIASRESGEPMGWSIWKSIGDRPDKLDYAARRFAIATSLDGRVLPRKRRVRRFGPSVMK
ncbi:MAG: hypothetical protein J0I96_15945 [Rhodanobacter sp.]|nr:hypothetical protein [Rhodanobacter sp.]